MKKLVIEKHKSLLLYSEAPKRYDEFYSLLLDGVNISEENLSEFSTDTQLLINDILPRLIEEARNEWSADVRYKVFPKVAKMKCSICRTNIEKVYFITNRISGDVLQVGSECVKQFVDEKQLKLAERNDRLFILNKQFPGIEEIIKGWKGKLNREIVLTREIEVPYSRLHGEILKLFNAFLDGAIQEKDYGTAFGGIGELLAERQRILAIADRYIEGHRGMDWIATRKIMEWLVESRDNPIINKITETGFVTPEIAGRIAEDDFMHWVGKKVNDLLYGTGILLTTVPQKRAYRFTPVSLPQASMMIKHSDLFKDFGDPIYNKMPLSSEGIVKISLPYDDSAYEVILQELARVARKSGLRHYNSDLRYNEVIFSDPLAEVYYKLKFTYFVDQFVRHLLLGELDPFPLKKHIVDTGIQLSKEQAVDKVNLWLGRI